MKTCKECHEPKELSEYYKFVHKVSGATYHRRKCKVCVRKHKREYRAGQAGIETRASKYKISATELETWLLITECQICSKELKTTYDQCLDHCHVTGKVRGILCRTCNTGIGGLQDNADIVLSAYKYLLAHS